MSNEKFNETYELVRSLPTESDKLKRYNKDELANKLYNALIALKYADVTISKQSDTIIATTNELVQLSASTRNSKPCVNQEFSTKSYANAVINTNVPILIKHSDDLPNFDCDEVKKKISDALRDINVNSTRITRNGDLLVNLLSSDVSKKATDSLKTVFKESIDIELAKKFPPKLTIVGLPSDFNQVSLIRDVCEKDVNIKNMIENGGCFEMIKCFDVKNEKGQIIGKKLAVKVSPSIRNYIINHNKGYLYLNLFRCKVYDRLMVLQCYHCYEYHHIANNCPNKSKNPTCGRCALGHQTKNCKSLAENCSNCSRSRPNEPKNHSAFSYKCPCYNTERDLLRQKTEYNDEKN